MDDELFIPGSILNVPTIGIIEIRAVVDGEWAVYRFANRKQDKMGRYHVIQIAALHNLGASRVSE